MPTVVTILVIYKNISYICEKFIKMKTTTVALGAHFDEFVQLSIKGGRYTNASEVIRAGLRRLEEDERRIYAIRSAVDEAEVSGYVEDFNFDANLEGLKGKRR